MRFAEVEYLIVLARAVRCVVFLKGEVDHMPVVGGDGQRGGMHADGGGALLEFCDGARDSVGWVGLGGNGL